MWVSVYTLGVQETLQHFQHKLLFQVPIPWGWQDSLTASSWPPTLGCGGTSFFADGGRQRVAPLPPSSPPAPGQDTLGLANLFFFFLWSLYIGLTFFLSTETELLRRFSLLCIQWFHGFSLCLIHRPWEILCSIMGDGASSFSGQPSRNCFPFSAQKKEKCKCIFSQYLSLSFISQIY